MNVPTSGVEGSPVSVSFAATSAYGESLTYSLVITGPNNFSRSFTTVNAQFTPPDDGDYQVQFSADDGVGGTASTSATIHVSNVNPQFSHFTITQLRREGTAILLCLRSRC